MKDWLEWHIPELIIGGAGVLVVILFILIYYSEKETAEDVKACISSCSETDEKMLDCRLKCKQLHRSSGDIIIQQY